MAYTKNQMVGGVAAAAVVAVAGGVALGMKLHKMWKVRKLKKTQVSITGEATQGEAFPGAEIQVENQSADLMATPVATKEVPVSPMDQA